MTTSTAWKIRIGKFGNELAFSSYDIPEGKYITVEDMDCQLSRTYKVGEKGILEVGEKEGIEIVVESFEQVIEAWESGKVWF